MYKMITKRYVLTGIVGGFVIFIARLFVDWAYNFLDWYDGDVEITPTFFISVFLVAYMTSYIYDRIPVHSRRMWGDVLRFGGMMFFLFIAILIPYYDPFRFDAAILYLLDTAAVLGFVLAYVVIKIHRKHIMDERRKEREDEGDELY